MLRMVEKAILPEFFLIGFSGFPEKYPSEVVPSTDREDFLPLGHSLEFGPCKFARPLAGAKSFPLESGMIKSIEERCK